jgi:IS5 family transposase
MLVYGRSQAFMRQTFDLRPELTLTPIEKIVLPLESRDELPPILAGLQWLWNHPTLKTDVLQRLAQKVLAFKQATGRPGLDLWQILVLGVVRLGLAANYDRLEDLANHHTLLRQMLGLPEVCWGRPAKRFRHQTLRDNVCLVDAELLQQINALVAAAGLEVFSIGPRPAREPLAVKVDTYVLETDVHFPTDLNLLLDAGRKCLDLIQKYRDLYAYELPGWRKLEDWRRRFKAAERVAGKVVFGGGKDKEKRVRTAVDDYLAVGRELARKTSASLLSLCDQPVDAADWNVLAYFEQMLAKHLDLVDRRLLQGQRIPQAEKVFSLFEPHTEWITKGKLQPPMELGHRLLVATDQHGLIQDYDVLLNQVDMGQSVPVADRLLGRYGVGQIGSISFDKGFSRAEDRELLRLYIPMVVMPKRGPKAAAEAEEESGKKFVALRRQHSAVESDIAALEHHGLNRCLDVGLEGYERYVGYGVLAFNLHRIGRQCLARQRALSAQAA